jgi:Tfp pilus assembly protein PilX
MNTRTPIRVIPAAQFRPISNKNERGIALPIALILVAVVLVAAVALMRNTGQDSLVSGNEADRIFATEATDAAMRQTLTEFQALSTIPELIDITDPKLAWWRNNVTPITGAYWSTCAAGSAGDKCVSESVTKSGRTYTVQRLVSPAGPPEPFGATSGSYTFFYRIAVLITLDNGARSESESYVRRPQLVK